MVTGGSTFRSGRGSVGAAQVEMMPSCSCLLLYSKSCLEDRKYLRIIYCIYIYNYVCARVTIVKIQWIKHG